jgi:hypothetical protein
VLIVDDPIKACEASPEVEPPAAVVTSSALVAFWISWVWTHPPQRTKSVSPTCGEKELSVWNGQDECTYYHPLFRIFAKLPRALAISVH